MMSGERFARWRADGAALGRRRSLAAADALAATGVAGEGGTHGRASYGLEERKQNTLNAEKARGIAPPGPVLA